MCAGTVTVFESVIGSPPPAGGVTVAETVALCGDFNDWAPDSIQLRRDADGRWTTDVELEAGRSYRYRFLLDGERWENDWTALAYEPNKDGGDDSVVVV